VRKWSLRSLYSYPKLADGSSGWRFLFASIQAKCISAIDQLSGRLFRIVQVSDGQTFLDGGLGDDEPRRETDVVLFTGDTTDARTEVDYG